MRISEFQALIRDLYYEKDKRRGVVGTGWWFVEEIGELFDTIKKGDRDKIKEEFADVFAWLCSLANLVNINLEESIQKYTLKKVCPKCFKNPCECKEPEFFLKK